MYFPKYWARGKWNSVSAWGWSDESLDKAREAGIERAKKVSQRIEGGEMNTYGYAHAPLREEILEEIKGDRIQAIISRNRYGSEILNTDQMIFIDADISVQAPKRSLMDFILGRNQFNEKEALVREEKRKLQLLENFAQKNSDFGFRIYRTAAGLRYLVTSHLFTPADPVVKELFTAVDCDPYYTKLCQLQKNFRARLTPKPWRCGLKKPQHFFPIESDEQQEAFSTWKTQYDKEAGKFQTTRFIKTIGSPTVLDEMLPLIEIHDTKTKALKNGALA